MKRMHHEKGMHIVELFKVIDDDTAKGAITVMSRTRASADQNRQSTEKNTQIQIAHRRRMRDTCSFIAIHLAIARDRERERDTSPININMLMRNYRVGAISELHAI